MIVFISFVDYIKQQRKDKKEISEKEMLKYTIEVGEEAGAYVTSKLKHKNLKNLINAYKLSKFSSKKTINLYITIKG